MNNYGAYNQGNGNDQWSSGFQPAPNAAVDGQFVGQDNSQWGAPSISNQGRVRNFQGMATDFVFLRSTLAMTGLFLL